MVSYPNYLNDRLDSGFSCSKDLECGEFLVLKTKFKIFNSSRILIRSITFTKSKLNESNYLNVKFILIQWWDNRKKIWKTLRVSVIMGAYSLLVISGLAGNTSDFKDGPLSQNSYQSQIIVNKIVDANVGKLPTTDKDLNSILKSPSIQKLSDLKSGKILLSLAGGQDFENYPNLTVTEKMDETPQEIIQKAMIKSGGLTSCLRTTTVKFFKYIFNPNFINGVANLVNRANSVNLQYRMETTHNPLKMEAPLELSIIRPSSYREQFKLKEEALQIKRNAGNILSFDSDENDFSIRLKEQEMENRFHERHAEYVRELAEKTAQRKKQTVPRDETPRMRYANDFPKKSAEFPKKNETDSTEPSVSSIATESLKVLSKEPAKEPAKQPNSYFFAESFTVGPQPRKGLKLTREQLELGQFATKGKTKSEYVIKFGDTKFGPIEGRTSLRLRASNEAVSEFAAADLTLETFYKRKFDPEKTIVSQLLEGLIVKDSANDLENHEKMELRNPAAVCSRILREARRQAAMFGMEPSKVENYYTQGRILDLITENGKLTIKGARETLSVLNLEAQQLVESHTIARPGHGLDFKAKGQGRLKPIKFIECKGPVAKAIMKKQADVHNVAQSFDPEHNGAKDALKILQQKEKWSNPNKLVKIKSKIDPALLPKSPKEVLGLADLFEMRDPA